MTCTMDFVLVWVECSEVAIYIVVLVFLFCKGDLGGCSVGFDDLNACLPLADLML